MKTPSTCPICLGRRIQKTRLKTTPDNSTLGTYLAYKCLSCQNLFTHPKPNYKNAILLPDKSISELSFIQKIALSFFLQQRLELVQKSFKTPLKDLAILDIGAGSCAFANAAVKNGAKVTVVEPNAKNKRFASRKINFHTGYFEEKTVKEISKNHQKAFDLITLWHVLEHCPDPNQVLKLAHKLLNRKGRLLIAVPNINSWQAKMGGNHWAYLDIPHHLFQFSPSGLDKLAAKNGLKLRSKTSFSLEYDIFGWQQSLLNIFTGSHNYFYNKAKKNRTLALENEMLTKLLTSLQFIFLPLSMLLTLASIFFKAPSCLIHVYEKK